ncbi:carbon-nitrogen hydrolase family protein [Trinickia violacea]|uniref:Carbon-nitrogen hydrolase family protein n=1 Tax=Trinickia violacea TaxID=2571746 RepID=A0A4P8IY74_9BURK|nr:carbon-nitrogen hydrolase family protein [Trinickia violacea]QCP52915.1 carbon-nitrogen hydrolase family protein [Trinickia violacea]
MSTHRVAVVQAGSTLFDTPRTLERMRAHCETLAREGAELAVFPEAYLGGYPKGLDFGTRVGSRSSAGRDDFLRYARSAIDVPGVETERIGAFAREARCSLVVGVIERGGATLYCTALFFNERGVLVAKHRKLMPTASERLIWGSGDGSTLPVVQSSVGKLGAAICWENYMPMLRQSMFARGVEIWCAPTVDERDMWQASMRHIAYEGRCFVLSACQFLTREDCPPDYDCIQGNEPGTQLIKGGSVIVSPLGEVLAGPVYGQEAVLTADIDLDDVVRGKYDLDVAGHYARPDVFSLHVDMRPKSSVVCTTDALDANGDDAASRLPEPPPMAHGE